VAPHATRSSSSRGLDSVSTSPQWQSSCCNLSRLAWPLLTQCLPPPLPCHGDGKAAATAWSKDDKQLAGTGGRVNGHARNGENRRQQYRENRSAHVATIGALLERRISYRNVAGSSLCQTAARQRLWASCSHTHTRALSGAWRS